MFLATNHGIKPQTVYIKIHSGVSYVDVTTMPYRICIKSTESLLGAKKKQDIRKSTRAVELLSRKISVFEVHSESKHHVVQTVFHELLVEGHELGSEGLEVVDSFVAQLQSVFVVGCYVGHLGLQLTVAVTQQLCYQTLLEDWTRKINMTLNITPNTLTGDDVL